MVHSDEELTVAQRLGQLLDRGLLPAGGPAEAAERLIERLERPARVALLGLPGSGKSAILNLLTGVVVVPETLRLPTIIVQYGAAPRMLCTLPDGRTEIVPGSDLNDVLILNPALVTLEMDLPALKVISLLEVSAGPMEAEQRRAGIWASKRADILIWCTTSYLPKEQQVWEGMPDVVKDNGFLFLTKVDLLGSREAAAGMLERVEMRAGEEFRQVLSISAKQARAAMPPGQPVDRELFRESGAAAVITTIKSRVQAARRADTDMAELLLARHVEASGIVARRFADPDGAAAVVPPAAPQWTPPPEVATEPEPKVVPVEVPEARAEVPDPVAEPEPEIALDPDPKPGKAVMDVPEPEPEPESYSEPEPVRAPAFERQPREEQEPQRNDGRRRFSDRIKQMPVSDDAPGTPLVPLRSTWKSKSETTGPARTAPPETESSPAAGPRQDRRGLADETRTPRPEPRARPASPPDAAPEGPKLHEPQDDDATLARMLAAASSTPPEAEAEEPEPVADDEDDARDLAESEAEDAAQDVAEREVDSPRWAERLMPSDTAAPPERSPRTQLFGARKAPAVAAPAPGARPGERVARPTEPVTRVRAPSPRPQEAPRPATPSPEDLATPRIMAMRDRPHAGLDAANPERVERRERPRIAARIGVSATPAAAVAMAIPLDDQVLLDNAIQQIVVRSAELVAVVHPDEKIPVDMILDHSRETVEQVMACLLYTSPSPRD